MFGFATRTGRLLSGPLAARTWVFDGRLDRLTDPCDQFAVSVQHALEAFAQVFQQVPSIHNLFCLGCALADAKGVLLGAISGHDLDIWVGFEPGCQSIGLSIWQEVNRFVGFEIHDQRSLGVTSLEGEVVHTDDFHRIRLRFWGAMNDPQERGRTGFHPQLLAESSASVAT